MQRIRSAFEKAASEKRSALVVYLTAGDPDLETTVKLIQAAAESGADIIEVGVPFSDPTADGPTIALASERAITRGANFTRVLEAVHKARALTSVPFVLFSYVNPILAYGEERAVSAAKEAGADGFLIVDLPAQEASSLAARCRAHDLAFVPLLAPTSTDERIEASKRLACGFAYYVSLTGVTGAAHIDFAEAGARAARLRERLGLPLVVGFGIKTAADIRQLAGRTDGIVVGSALVDAIHKAGSPDRALAAARELVRSLRGALNP